MNDRIRLALLIFVVMTCVTARVGGALGATNHADLSAKHAVSHATAVAHKQAKVVRFARHLLGVRYVYGGASPEHAVSRASAASLASASSEPSSGSSGMM